MKKYSVKITIQAREHLKAIKQDYKFSSPKAAKEHLQELKEQMRSLTLMPQRIKLTEEEPWRSLGIHQMIIKPYYVYFWIDESNKTVQIIAIINISRNQYSQLKRVIRIIQPNN
ncbi:MAG: type II toxin-antitoxin system RelE/ParE family toxin [Parasporobacterium sp.]|nr:type II toxin-antitoxin system RelE/ParE family toxin [Parasporobacterium sp.]